MKKTFNAKVTEINTIGDELRFQRDYYNFKHSSSKLIPRIATRGTKSKFLGKVLENFLDTNFEYMKVPKKADRENYGEYGTGEDLLYAIEHNRLKSGRNKKQEKYNPNAYYLRMYSLFKIYGFLDDYEIIMLLDRYNIEPRFEKTEEELYRLKKKCFNEYKENPNKKAFNMKLAYISTSYYINEEILEKSNEINFISDEYQELLDLVKNKKGRNWIFRTFKKQLLNYFKDLTKIERKCLSLDLGKETSFIDDILQNKIYYITYDTLLKMTNVLGFKNTEIEYILKFETEYYKEKKRYNQTEVEKDLFDFRKKWGF